MEKERSLQTIGEVYWQLLAVGFSIFPSFFFLCIWCVMIMGVEEVGLTPETMAFILMEEKVR